MNLRYLAGLFFLAAVSSTATAEDPLTFERDVRPILKTHCFHCHGEDGETKSDLDVRLQRFLLKGGKDGPAIVPGNPEQSLLVKMLREGEMPKEKSKLPEKDIATIAAWIKAGAITARPEPESLDDAPLFTEEERAWWSFQPIGKVGIPESKGSEHPIDAFITRKLAPNSLSLSARADARTLIRRATFDLTGLPPTPEEITAFEASHEKDSSTASSALIDRLLNAPAYGERWARHWLDVAGYADSDGVTEKDLERKHAWKYRDYVIRSLNADKPFDAFVREQLAGDEMASLEGVHANSETEEERARYAELLTATGFLRMAPDGTGAKNDLLTRNASITDTMKIVSTAFYGMTIQCAECHDHRYDPITQADFYQLRAVFQPGFNPVKWKNPKSRLVSLQTNDDKAKAAVVEAEAKVVETARLKKQAEFIQIVLEKELLKRDEGDREAIRTAYNAVVKERTPEQVSLLKGHPTINKLTASTLYLYDQTYKTKYNDELKKRTAEAAKIREKKPKNELVHAFVEAAMKPEAIPATFLFHRGDPESPKDEVTPSDLDVLAGWRKTEFPGNQDTVPTSGRRLALGASLTDGSHPLLARVMVNRVWMHHFGTGLVKTVADFGHLGEKPSHPELLDWLAQEFIARGWSLKELHRLILSSHTWQQQSQRDDVRDEIDPDNRLLSRQSKRRLEAETLRDSLLAVSGKLSPKQFGEPVPVMITEEGQVVIGVDTTDTAGRQTGKFISLEGQEFRRSIYVQIRRSRPLDLFAAFDAPPMTDANCEIRPVTTVSPQSLLLMNNIGMREHSQYFAQRVEKECAGASTDETIKHAWKLAYGREPSEVELAEASDFLTLQTAYYTVVPTTLERLSGPVSTEAANPHLLGLTALTHALLSTNEFLYID